jgi:SAM-dependent methyltransferase
VGVADLACRRPRSTLRRQTDIVPADSDRNIEPWSWDETLYAGSATHYPVGRVSYPPEVVDVLVPALALDGTGRLLDVGCGPGSLTVLLAPWYAECYGVDADADMLAEAARVAAETGVANVRWRHLRAEELPAELPPVDTITFAQSFHWFDRPRVAATARGMLSADGAVVHLHANTHQGVETDEPLPHPSPPWAAVAALVTRYLGPVRRAGRGLLPEGTPGGEDEIYRGAGFRGPERLEVPGRVLSRTAPEIAASVYSLSGSAPHLFGSRLADFDVELRELLRAASPAGTFSEQMRPVLLDVWR